MREERRGREGEMMNMERTCITNVAFRPILKLVTKFCQLVSTIPTTTRLQWAYSVPVYR